MFVYGSKYFKSQTALIIKTAYVSVLLLINCIYDFLGIVFPTNTSTVQYLFKKQEKACVGNTTHMYIKAKGTDMLIPRSDNLCWQKKRRLVKKITYAYQECYDV